MKKVLGLAVLMMVMLMSVTGLAVSDIVNVPVYLNVPQFVRLSVDSSDPNGQFDLALDPAQPHVNPSDTVKLLAEANVNYKVEVTDVSDSTGNWTSWVNLLDITLTPANPTGGFLAGSQIIIATATLDLSNGLPDWMVIDPATKIADVTFTIASI